MYNKWLKVKYKKEYKDKIKNLKYRNHIEKIFNKQKRKTFTMSFKHPEYDDELLIEAIAKKYGYEIINEHLTREKSVYTFTKTVY